MQVDESCESLMVTFCSFRDCHSQTNGGSLHISKSVPMAIYSVEFVDSTAKNIGGGVYSYVSSISLKYLCMLNCSSLNNGNSNNVFHAGNFAISSERGMSDACQCSICQCPRESKNSDLTIWFNGGVQTVSFLNCTNNQPNRETMVMGGEQCDQGISYLNIIENVPSELIDNWMSKRSSFENCNLCRNNKKTTSEGLFSTDYECTLKNSVVIGNTAGKFKSGTIECDTVYFYNNSFRTNEVRTETLRIKEIWDNCRHPRASAHFTARNDKRIEILIFCCCPLT